MPTTPVAIVADAGPDVGLGHLSRAGAVAAALASRGIETRCYGYDADKPFTRDRIVWSPLAVGELTAFADHVTVIDTYHLPRAAAARLAASCRLVVMHDDGEIPKGAALVVSVPGGEFEGAPLLGGLRYAALRPEFWGLPDRQVRERVTRVLVTMGSGQPGSSGSRLAEAVAQAMPTARVTLVSGPGAQTTSSEGVQTLHTPTSLFRPLVDADLVVTAAGQTMLEAAAAGTPCVAVVLAANQRGQARRLNEMGAVRVVDPPDPEAAANAARALAADAGLRRELSRAGQEAVDGFGALRVAFQIAVLSETNQ